MSMSAIPAPESTDSPIPWWEELGALIEAVWFYSPNEALDPPENCIFGKSYDGHYYPREDYDTVLSATTIAEPATPDDGDKYIVPVGATGTNWSGEDNKIATYVTDHWEFEEPTDRDVVFSEDDEKYYIFEGFFDEGGSWIDGTKFDLVEVPGGLKMVQRCQENDLAGGLIYNVSDINPPYAPQTKFRRNCKLGRRMKAKMVNSGTVDIKPEDPICPGPYGRMKLFDAAAASAGARQEGRAIDAAPVGKAGRVYIQD